MLTSDQEKSREADKRESLRYLKEDMPSVLKNIISEYYFSDIAFTGNFDYVTLDDKKEKVYPGNTIYDYKGSTFIAWFERYEVGVKYNVDVDVNVDKSGSQKYIALYNMKGKKMTLQESIGTLMGRKLSCHVVELKERIVFVINFSKIKSEIERMRDNSLDFGIRIPRIVMEVPEYKFTTIVVPEYPSVPRGSYR